MGMQDRDYMRRGPDDDDHRRRSREDSPMDYGDDGILGRFFRRNPRFPMCVGIGIGILILIALLVVKFSGSGH
jgi:hypothetical protein